MSLNFDIGTERAGAAYKSMPMYYFHTDSETCTPDKQGTELANMAAARIEAAKITADLLKGRASLFWGTKPWSITCTDKKGLIFFVMEVHGISSAAGGT